MNILQFDLDNYDLDEVISIVKYLENQGMEVIAIPKDFDLLLDCDTFTLTLIKEKIEAAIRKKEIINNM
jgi:energy-coupling factor transporter ATP-binding protein EcfA2